MFRKALALAVFLILASPGTGRADPILTPLLATYVVGNGVAFTIFGQAISYASIAPHSIKAPK